MADERITIIPCSGMGKVYGLAAREIALKLGRELRPARAETVCLAYIVTADREAKERIAGKPCLTLDGCPAMCAAKNVEIAGGLVKERVKMLDMFKEYKGANPGTATDLTEEGWKIVDEIADKIAAKVDELVREIDELVREE